MNQIESYFIRDEEDEDHFTIVPNELLRNPNISTSCRWLIAYLLSHDRSWKIQIPYIMKSQKISKDKMYSMIDQAIENGYVKRETFMENGMKKYKYLISKHAKFKKCLPCPENQDTGNLSMVYEQRPENQDTIEEQSYSSSSKEDSEQEYKKMVPKSKPTSDSASPESESIYKFFLASLKKRNSAFKEPNKKKWLIELDRILRIDKRDPNEAIKLIEWSETARFFKSSCLSPEKLRKHYDEMLMKSNEIKEIQQESENRQYLTWVLNEYKIEMQGVSFNKLYVVNTKTGIEIPFSLPFISFKEALDNIVRSACIKK